jgi:hypothetical protein
MDINNRTILLGSKITAKKNMLQAIEAANQQDNLLFVLDAADETSYPGTGNQWFDISGNNNHFFLGNGIDTSAYPTFTGTAGGRSENEYFSFDGGDYVTIQNNTPALNSLHNKGALYSWLGFFYIPNFSIDAYLFATGSITNQLSGTGWRISTDTSFATWDIDSQQGGQLRTGFAPGFMVANQWNTFGVGINESGGAGESSLLVTGGLSGTFNSVYFGNWNSVGNTLTMGAESGGSTRFASGYRLGCVAMWMGRRLTRTELTAVHSEIRGRYGI